MKNKVLLVFGTRPEVIKMAPVYRSLRSSHTLEPITCVTAQHRELLDQMLQVFEIRPDYDLNLMSDRQSLASLTSRALEGITQVIQSVRPDYLLVQGDTTTALAAAMAGFYQQVPVGHVEAGLRTAMRYDPYPEEMNRRLIGSIADVHYAPTSGARDNLLREGVPEDTVVLSGNTVVDAMTWMLEVLNAREPARCPTIDGIEWTSDIPILVTAHRRENWGALPQLCEAIRRVASLDKRVQIIFPVHPNPIVRETVRRELGDHSRVHLLDPLPYPDFVQLMARCALVLTDSGGVQEEVASLGKRIVVMRTTTERPEIIAAGYGVLAGTEPSAIEAAVRKLLFAEAARPLANPFGDGHAATRIARHLESLLLPKRMVLAVGNEYEQRAAL